MSRVAHLVMVTDKNNNKFYDMEEIGDTIQITYGRVGSKGVRCIQPSSKWKSIYNQKIKKGYVDQTYLYKVKDEDEEDSYIPIENENIRNIVRRLQQYAITTIKNNFDVNIDAVTDDMVYEALNIIYSLSEYKKIEDFNRELLRLFSVIPRKMNNVKEFLSESKKDFVEIIKREEDLLDVVMGQISQNKISQNNDKKDITILEEMGLEFAEVSDKEVALIKKELGSESYKFHNAWRVKNIAQENKFDEFAKAENIEKTKLLWHGSRSENIWSILCNSLKLKPNAIITGKMFGDGIYFAPKAKKSLGYTSLAGSYWSNGNDNTGFMILNEVAYGTPFDVYEYENEYGRFNYKKLKKRSEKYNCMHVHGSKSTHSFVINDEIIIYNESQCRPRYLVELKNNKKNHN